MSISLKKLPKCGVGDYVIKNSCDQKKKNPHQNIISDFLIMSTRTRNMISGKKVSCRILPAYYRRTAYSRITSVLRRDERASF